MDFDPVSGTAQPAAASGTPSSTQSPAPAPVPIPVPPFLAKVRAARAASASLAPTTAASSASTSAGSTGGILISSATSASVNGSNPSSVISSHGVTNGGGAANVNVNSVPAAPVGPASVFGGLSPSGALALSGNMPPASPSTAANTNTTPPAPANSKTSTPSTLPSNPAAALLSSTQTQPPPNALYLLPPAAPSVEEDLVPPENFAAVTQGVYRCGFPKKRNFKFLETLQLKTVLTLVLEDYPEANLQWCQDQDIQFMQFGIPGNKEPFDNIPEDVICSALVAILDRRNHPLLIHCNKGKHRTGCLIGCIRRLQSWSLTSIFDEYRRFSDPKSRAVDQQFIDLFDIGPVWTEAVAKGGGLANLPKWPMLTLPVSLAALRETERERASERERRATVAGAAAAAAAVARMESLDSWPEVVEVAVR